MTVRVSTAFWLRENGGWQVPVHCVLFRFTAFLLRFYCVFTVLFTSSLQCFHSALTAFSLRFNGVVTVSNVPCPGERIDPRSLTSFRHFTLQRIAVSQNYQKTAFVLSRTQDGGQKEAQKNAIRRGERGKR